MILEETNLDQSAQEDKKVNHDNILNSVCWRIQLFQESKEIANDPSRFIANVLKDKISSLENQVKSKYAIIEYLTNPLLSSNLKESQMKHDECNLNESFNGDKLFYDKESRDESNNG